MIMIAAAGHVILHAVQISKPVADHPDVIFTSAALVTIVMPAITDVIMEIIAPHDNIVPHILHKIFSQPFRITDIIIFNDNMVRTITPAGGYLIPGMTTNSIATDKIIAPMDKYSGAMMDIISQNLAIRTVYVHTASEFPIL